MKTLLTVILAIAAPLSAAELHGPSSESATIGAQGPRIHILLEKDVPSALVEAKGSYRVLHKETSKSLSFGVAGKRFVMQAMQHGLRWGEEYPDVHQITIIPTSKSTTISVNGIQYKGAISVYHMKGNHIAIVNEVSIEEYLKATLAVKYEENELSEEALAALTILDRTDAYNKAFTRTGRPWDVTARETGYFGSGNARPYVVENAVNSTRYMVLHSAHEEAPIQNPYFSPSRAETLAQKGMDAQKILKSAFPKAHITVTTPQEQMTIR